MKLAIAIPTYNEAQNIKKLLPGIKKSLLEVADWQCTVFIIDDNSPDKTAAVARQIGTTLADQRFKVEVLSRKKKEGLGKAYIYAFNEILKQEFDYILQMDADLSHDPKYLPDFLGGTKKSDFVVGSRYVKGGATPDWSWQRKLQSHGGNIYTRLFLGSRITDYTGGYNLYASGLLRKIDLNSLEASGYGFLIELKYDALKFCKQVTQVPIIFMDRQHGKSKIPRDTILKNLLLVPRLRFNRSASSKA
jgi:dolichol-phosphate mannosyltransferase